MFKDTFQAISSHCVDLTLNSIFSTLLALPLQATLLLQLRDESADGDPKLQLQDGVAKGDGDTRTKSKLKLNVDDEAQTEVRVVDDTALHLPPLKLQLQVAVAACC